MGTIGAQLQFVDAAHAVRRRDDDSTPKLSTGLALATVGASTSFMPSKYARGAGRQAIVTAGSALAAGFVGSALAAPAAELAGTGDALRGGVLIGAVGLGAAIVGRRIPNGGTARDVGHLVSSLGTIAAVGGGAVAATEAVDRLDIAGLDARVGPGLVVGIVGGAATLGVLASRGALRPAPTVAQAARSTIRPGEDALSRWTPELGRADYTNRSAQAKRLFEELPGVTSETWSSIGKGRSYLRGTATSADIAETTNAPAIRDPRRLLVSTAEAKTPEAKAALMLERFDAAGGIKYGTVHVISPAAIGDTNEVVPLAVEHAKRGDVITLMTQTSQSEPYFVLHKVGDAQRTLDLVLRGLQQRFEALPVDERPDFLLSALCYGALSPVELGEEALRARGLSHVLLEGSPALRRESRATIGRISRGEQAGAIAYSRADLQAIAAGDETPFLTMHQHRNDPLRVGLNSLLVPPSSQEGRPFIPVMSAINAFGDFGIDAPTGTGVFREVGHGFQATGVDAANAAFDLGLDAAQVQSIEQHAVLRDALRGIGRPA